MTQPVKSSNVLAHWKYEPELWSDFLKFEDTIYKGSVRAARHLFFGLLFSTITFIFLFLLVPFLITGKWNPKYLQPAIGIGIVAGFFIFLAGILWLYRRERMRRVSATTGEIIISLKGVSTNGVDFSWDFMKPGLSFEKVERKSVSVASQKNFEILEFYTANFTSIDRRRIKEKFECRIPIPFGKESEAENIMTRLRSRLLTAEQNWLRENFALSHNFSIDLLRN